MKPTAQFLVLLFASLAISAVAEDSPAPPAKTAVPEPTPAPAAHPADQFLIPGLPKYSPPPAETKPGETQPANVPNPDVLELPKMVVKQKPRPRLTPEIMVTKKAYGEQLAKEKFSSLDQALNKFTLPLFGASIAERALEEHEREKKAQMASDVSNLVKALETADPAEAKALKDAAARP
jgi:hypothetical protein